MDEVTITAGEPAETSDVHDAVVAAVEEVEHRHEIADQLDRIEEHQGDQWQNLESRTAALEAQIASMGATLLELSMRQSQSESAADQALAIAEEAISEDQSETSSEEIDLEPEPEPEPEREPERRGFSPLRKILGSA